MEQNPEKKNMFLDISNLKPGILETSAITPRKEGSPDKKPLVFMDWDLELKEDQLKDL